MIKTIPAGYHLTVTSWENGDDDYNTKTVRGLSLSATRLLTDIIQLFYSRNNPPAEMVCYGNLYEPMDWQIAECYAAIQTVLDRHPAVQDPDLKDYFTDPAGVTEYLYEVGLMGGEFWSRVLGNFEVEYYPTEVNVEVVTQQFERRA